MDDYIKREDAINALNELCEQICPYSKLQRGAMCGACTLGSAIEVIEDEIPSADVRENVRGDWILFGDEKSAKAKCAQCGFKVCVTCERSDSFVAVKSIVQQYIFCPNCGADMRGDQNDKS